MEVSVTAGVYVDVGVYVGMEVFVGVAVATSVSRKILLVDEVPATRLTVI